MHSRASAIRMKKKWKKKKGRSNTKFIPDLSRRFYTRRRCPSVDDYVDVVRPTWCREKNHRCTWNHGLHPLRPSFLLSFASSSCIIPYLESCEPGETMRVVVRARNSPPRPRICRGDPTRTDTWPQVAEREPGNLVYPGHEQGIIGAYILTGTLIAGY